jgi:hypothetical protein
MARMNKMSSLSMRIQIKNMKGKIQGTIHSLSNINSIINQSSKKKRIGKKWA